MSGNKGLLNKKRFEWVEEEKVEYLKNLSLKESVRILESLTSPGILAEFVDRFLQDHPMCLKKTLKKKKWQILPRPLEK